MKPTWIKHNQLEILMFNHQIHIILEDKIRKQKPTSNKNHRMLNQGLKTYLILILELVSIHHPVKVMALFCWICRQLLINNVKRKEEQ